MGLKDKLFGGDSDDESEEQSFDQNQGGLDSGEHVQNTNFEPETELGEESEPEDTFFGTPESELNENDEDLREMTSEDREGYLMNQDYSDLRWLIDNTESEVAAETFGEALRRDVRLGKIDEKVNSPEFWKGNPQATEQLEESLEDSEELEKEDIVGQMERDDYKEVMRNLFSESQYEMAAEFSEFVEASNFGKYRSRDGLKERVAQQLVEETKGEYDENLEKYRGNVENETWKELFALVDSTTDLTRKELAELANVETSSGFTEPSEYREDDSVKELLKNKISFTQEGHDWQQWVDEEIDKFDNENDYPEAKEKTLARDKVSEAFFKMQNEDEYQEAVQEAVEGFRDTGEYDQAAMTLSRFEMEDQMAEVVEEAESEEVYQLASALNQQGIDLDYEENQIMEEVGDYVNKLVKEDQDMETAAQVAEEFEGVQEYLGPDTRLELRKAQSS